MSLYDLYRQLTLSRKIFLLFLAAVLLRIYLEYDSSQESFRSSVKDNNCSLDIYRDLKSRHSITEQSLNASKDESAVYQRKKIFLLVVLCIYQGYEIQVILKPQIDDNNSPIIERLHSSVSSEVESAVHQQKKIFFAFFYWEQLTMATNNLLHLSALAAPGGRQVVVPFVKDSQFRGVPQSQKKQPNHKLGLYYDVTALNESLRLHGHGTLINWEGFQDVCKGKLDVLIYFYYSKLTSSTNAPCNVNHKNVVLGIKIGRRICVNANAFESVQRFEEEIVKRLPCVGIFEW